MKMTMTGTAIDAAALSARLQDLGQFGIHLANPRGICFLCKKSIPRSWSDGMGLDPRCESCYRKRDSSDPIYSPATVWVRKTLDTTYARTSYHAILKIDGELYEARQATGSSTDLYDLEGKRVMGFALHDLSSHTLQTWHASQGDTKTYAFVAQFFWPGVKEKVAHEVHYHASVVKEVPFYDIGHCGRGIEEEGRVYVRLYLMPPSGMPGLQDFDVLAVQLVKTADAPYLENHEVAVFPKDTVVLKWSQAGALFVEALTSLENKYVAQGFKRAAERFAKDSEQHPLPADYWMVLRLDRRYAEKSDPTHELRDILLLPKA